MQSNKSSGQLTAQINLKDQQKSGFDLSNNVLGTGKIGRIIPTRALHVMPGDTIKQDSKVAVQFEPLAVPILANMEVKQEHFYVPYNVVWQNWDKFISGGEKMDYSGVVPNKSLKDIVMCVVNILPRFTFDIETSIPNFGIPEFDDMIYTAPRLLASVGDTYGIRDLLKPQFEVLKQLRERVLSNPSWCSVSLKLIQGSSDIDTARLNFDNYLSDNGLTGDKYLNELRNKIVTGIMLHENALLPTSDFLELLHLAYDYYRPFFGYGSNLDYLNMCRLSFSEFLWVILEELSSNFAQSSSSRIGYYFLQMRSINLLSNKPLSVLHLRANYSVWYNNYRDILLETKPKEPSILDEVNNTELFTLLVPRQRCWEKDAFTTALDNPGTGNVAVPITYNTESVLLSASALKVIKEDSTDTEAIRGMYDDMDIASITIDDKTYKLPTAFLRNLGGENDNYEYQGFSLYALDAAQRAQKWLQKALFFGNRISDFYYLRFGVRFLDSRLRLPELLTSSSELVRIDTIMNNTSIPSEGVVAGDRAGFASAYDNGNSFDRFCEEHGVILSYLTIMPQVTYANGSSRDYSRLDQFDFAFSEFATLGMDAIYTDEITASSLADVDKLDIFGYQGKYYDYKAKHSEEHGELLDSQDMYTFSRKFNMFDEDSRPKLNYEFVHCFPSLDMFVVDSSLVDYFRYDIRHSTAAERGLPSQSIYI